MCSLTPGPFSHNLLGLEGGLINPPSFFSKGKGMQYPLVYRMLLDRGHSVPRALEILLDAHRGDQWSMRWIRWLKMTG